MKKIDIKKVLCGIDSNLDDAGEWIANNKLKSFVILCMILGINTTVATISRRISNHIIVKELVRNPNVIHLFDFKK